MIEMLGVLAIIGVLSAGGIFAYSTAMENYKTNKLIDDLSYIASGARGIFLKYRKLSTNNKINIPELYRLGIIPEEYYKNYNASTLTTKSPWNTDEWIYIIEWKGNTKKGKTELYYTARIPYAACIKFATYPWNNSFPNSYMLTYKEAGGYYYGSHPYLTVPLPFSRSLAEEYCGAGGGKKVLIEGGIGFSSQ